MGSFSLNNWWKFRRTPFSSFRYFPQRQPHMSDNLHACSYRSLKPPLHGIWFQQHIAPVRQTTHTSLTAPDSKRAEPSRKHVYMHAQNINTGYFRGIYYTFVAESISCSSYGVFFYIFFLFKPIWHGSADSQFHQGISWTHRWIITHVCVYVSTQHMVLSDVRQIESLLSSIEP